MIKGISNKRKGIYLEALAQQPNHYKKTKWKAAVWRYTNDNHHHISQYLRGQFNLTRLGSTGENSQIIHMTNYQKDTIIIIK